MDCSWQIDYDCLQVLEQSMIYLEFLKSTRASPPKGIYFFKYYIVYYNYNDIICYNVLHIREYIMLLFFTSHINILFLFSMVST